VLCGLVEPLGFEEVEPVWSDVPDDVELAPLFDVWASNTLMPKHSNTTKRMLRMSVSSVMRAA
jgi:hypothetical protein